MSKELLLRQLLNERILVLDGAMGSLIQTYLLDEAGFRGERFCRPPIRRQGQQRSAQHHSAGHHPRHLPRLPRCRRGS